MHRCYKSKQKLVDLVFGELTADKKLEFLMELGGCAYCRQIYRSGTDLLQAFTVVNQRDIPDEAYWKAYNERLVKRLNRVSHPKMRQRIAGQQGGISPQKFWLLLPPNPRMILPILMFICALTVPIFIYKYGDRATKLEKPELIKPDVASDNHEVKEGGNNHQQKVVSGKRQRILNLGDFGERRDLFVSNTRQDRSRLKETAANRELNDHIREYMEASQLLLRTFRNMTIEEDGSYPNISFERRYARRLLNSGRILKHNLPVHNGVTLEDILIDLELCLLDIANLPENPSSEEVNLLIAELRKKGAVALLQPYLASRAFQQ